MNKLEEVTDEIIELVTNNCSVEFSHTTDGAGREYCDSLMVPNSDCEEKLMKYLERRLE